MRGLDFSSGSAILTTLFGLALVTVIGVGIRLIVMQTIQQRRERENRQVNERLKILIAAYKTLGGSFTGNLTVDPTHLRDLRHVDDDAEGHSSDRTRRMRDAVEAALSDIILLGTEEQVRLASKVASELVAGRHAETAELVVSLRDFIRKVLALEQVPADASVPRQGPTRPGSGAGKGKGDGKDEGRGGRGGGGGMGAAAGGMGGMGLGLGMGLGAQGDDSSST